jgi:hypothetical protein
MPLPMRASAHGVRIGRWREEYDVDAVSCRIFFRSGQDGEEEDGGETKSDSNPWRGRGCNVKVQMGGN